MKGITLKDVTDCIKLPQPIHNAVKGIVECTYVIALHKGKTEDEAVTVAVDKLGSILRAMERRAALKRTIHSN